MHFQYVYLPMMWNVTSSGLPTDPLRISTTSCNLVITGYGTLLPLRSDLRSPHTSFVSSPWVEYGEFKS